MAGGNKWDVILEKFIVSINSLRRLNDDLDLKRESLIRLSRELYIDVRNGFKYLYSGEYDKAFKHIKKAHKTVENIRSVLRGVRDRYDLVKVVQDSLREYVEVVLLYSISTNELKILRLIDDIPPEILVEGYVDFAGELNRMVISKLIEGRCDETLEYIDLIEKIYIYLIGNPIDNYILREYKRKVDRVRAILDKVKSDYLYRCSRDEH